MIHHLAAKRFENNLLVRYDSDLHGINQNIALNCTFVFILTHIQMPRRDWRTMHPMSCLQGKHVFPGCWIFVCPENMFLMQVVGYFLSGKHVFSLARGVLDYSFFLFTKNTHVGHVLRTCAR